MNDGLRQRKERESSGLHAMKYHFHIFILSSKGCYSYLACVCMHRQGILRVGMHVCLHGNEVRAFITIHDSCKGIQSDGLPLQFEKLVSVSTASLVSGPNLIQAQ